MSIQSFSLDAHFVVDIVFNSGIIRDVSVKIDKKLLLNAAAKKTLLLKRNAAKKKNRIVEDSRTYEM
jgi:hypothetical protein